MDIPSFFRTYPPFDELSEEELGEVVRHTHIEFYPAGALILQQSAEPSRFLYVVRVGAVEVIDGTQVTDVLGEGEVFGHFSLLSGMGPAFTIRAHEEAICYLVDGEVAKRVMGTRRGLAFLSATLRKREVRAVDGLDRVTLDPWQTSVHSLIRRPPVVAPITFSIREAAEMMSTEHVSSLLVERAGGLAILTDRDLRSRVLARGRSPDTFISEVLTFPVHTVTGDMMVAEVMALMLERGVHHVPVLDDSGQLLGVVTDSDLMGLEQKTAFALKADIDRATSVKEVVALGLRLPETACSMVEANVDPLDVGHAIAVVIDALTRRLLELAIRKFGDPPCSWAWVSLGSEARQEQALFTDQDNAIMLDTGETPLAMVDAFFGRMAAFVNDHLQEAGIPKCRAGVIASNPEWRDSVLQWEYRFRRWIADPGRVGSAFTGIAFDYRPVAGPLEVRPTLDEVIRSAPREPQFVRHLARLAIDGRPPTGFLKAAVVEAKGNSSVSLDVKHGGITPITNLARVYSIGAGLAENRTLHRLREVAAVGRIDEETREGLEEAFRLLWQIRLEHQAGRVRVGLRPDDLVDPRDLGPLTRQGVREAFRMIERAQNALAVEMGLRR
ncbi:MAG: CBS domain-containing protein [Actinobacteria bacterium]|nr:CBS domain-containing protein [Actinomycetota bacterium]